jgi:hypothetical protein
MLPLTENQIRSSFVNASRREVAQATLPPLDTLDWASLEYLGWRDRKAPLSAYVVAEVDGDPVGVLLRSTEKSAGRARRKAVCQWCTDVLETDDVTLWVARRAGAAGRKGDTIGTLICTQFACSQNVRRRPTRAEIGDDAEGRADAVIARRVAELRERSAQFVRAVLATR